jgi:hypothetical protein
VQQTRNQNCELAAMISFEKIPFTAERAEAAQRIIKVLVISQRFLRILCASAVNEHFANRTLDSGRKIHFSVATWQLQVVRV